MGRTRHGKVSALLDEEPGLYWDSTYAIALALLDYYPNKNPVDVGLNELTEMIEALPAFRDDPALVTERILLDIQIVWYEEATDL
jgi:FeS assembly protein IscX